MQKGSKIFLSLLILCAGLRLAFAESLPYIDKSKIRLAVAPGKQAFGEINLENPTKDARAMRLYLSDWRYLPAADGTKEFVPAGTLANSCAPWMTFSPAEFVLPPFSKQRVSFSVKLPPDASGGYYAALFFETQLGKIGKVDVEREANIDLKIRIATLFYVEAEGTVDRAFEFGDFSLKSQGPGLLMKLGFKNTGNVDITCGGSFYLMSKAGQVVARGEFNDIYTSAGSSGTLQAKWDEAIPQGKYGLVLTLDTNKALLEGFGTRTPPVTKETEVEISSQGQVSEVGQLH
ncbi:MAG: hypothetical protein PHT31_06590 [Candidatus Omnitrophica bacterium]|nr:hypothetical protein [Candidatus Omnitrophota bacterium]MDD5653804.1 hypothetical protein [Candidatus Omnitrophota bacterium]